MVEVEALLAAQADGDADQHADAVGGQGAEQHRVVAQEADGKRREDQGGKHAQNEAGDAAEESERHQADDHAATDRGAQFEEHAYGTLQRQQFEAADHEHAEGGEHGTGEGLVGDAFPEQAGDHREDDRAPQGPDEDQHAQDVELEAGEDHSGHGRHHHGQAAYPEHDLGVGFAAGQVLAIDVGHDDRRQGGQVRVGGGRQRADDHDEEQADHEGRQVGRGHLRDQVVQVAIHRLHTRQQRQQAEHAQADDDRAVAQGGGNEGRLDQVFAHREQPLGDGLVADGI